MSRLLKHCCDQDLLVQASWTPWLNRLLNKACTNFEKNKIHVEVRANHKFDQMFAEIYSSVTCYTLFLYQTDKHKHIKWTMFLVVRKKNVLSKSDYNIWL